MPLSGFFLSAQPQGRSLYSTISLSGSGESYHISPNNLPPTLQSLIYKWTKYMDFEKLVLKEQIWPLLCRKYKYCKSNN